eukprot:CAMPEP_0169386122 /NCGR_PEP_ID=MMETSP1017-20121227/44535_1 /TAXON_ID=342587 /ORGANISM="Karlodinium micrum, Strain CCMP2283" /LENGTH=38 /DNA_ID= /DNA_START= /DNA_END= /DNA_ORIENTATION=
MENLSKATSEQQQSGESEKALHEQKHACNARYACTECT